MRVDGFPQVFSASAGSARILTRRVQLRRISAGLLFSMACAAFPASLAPDGVQVSTQAPASPSAEAKQQSDSAAKSLKLQKAEAAENIRKRQLAEESNRLLAMALSLKAEMDKTGKDTLSLKVIRKADEIERLAKTVKEKIKQVPGAG